MEPLSRDKLAANSYRTLGISASSSQAAIESAARRMRIWPNPQRIPPTPWDLPWLGPLARTRMDIERAVALLAEPTSRLEERLTWYHGSRPPFTTSENSGAQIEPPADLQATPMGEIALQHDAAIALLHKATFTDPEASDAALWGRVMEALNVFSTSAGYAEWIAAMEAAGDFEKPASRDEIAAAIAPLPAALANALIPKSLAAQERGDAAACQRIVDVFRAGGARAAAAEPLGRLLDQLEDDLGAAAAAIDRELRDHLRTNRDNPFPFYTANYFATQHAAKQYMSTVDASLRQMCAIVQGDDDRLQRSRSKCADVVALIALGWEWSGEFVAAEGSYKAALQLAQGSAGAAAIARDVERCRPLADQERQRVARGGPKPRQLAKQAGKRNERGLVWVVVVIVMGCLRFLGSDRDGYNRHNALPDLRIQTQQDLNRIMSQTQRDLDRIQSQLRESERPDDGQRILPRPKMIDPLHAGDTVDYWRAFLAPPASQPSLGPPPWDSGDSVPGKQ